MRKLSKTAKLGVLLSLLILVVGVYWLIYTGYGQSVDFQEYKPVLLPVSIETKNGEFYVLRNKGLLPSFDKHINVNLNLPNSWLAEWKSNGHLTNPCSDFPDETNCHNYVTPMGQHFQLAGGAIPSQTSAYEYDVRFIKNDTEIWITISPKQIITVATWNSVVDSFQHGHYSGLKVIRGSSSGP